MTTTEGLIQGARCLAAPAHHWQVATVRRVNEDGTYNIEFDQKDLILMPQWFGVTDEELSFNDTNLWEELYERVCPAGIGFRMENFQKLLADLGFTVTADGAEQYWCKTCKKLFAVDEIPARQLSLKKESAYNVLLEAGICAKQLLSLLRADKRQKYCKTYWNQTRMGGRDPSEIRRGITLDDAFVSLGIARNGIDQKKQNAFSNLEAQDGISVPNTLMTFLCQRGVTEAFKNCHPNNPDLLSPDNSYWNSLHESPWEVRRDLSQAGIDGNFAIKIVEFEVEWWAVFNENETDARIYAHWYHDDDSEAWSLCAPSVALFFWDLAQTGLIWEQSLRVKRAKPVKPVKQTDVGLMYAND